MTVEIENFLCSLKNLYGGHFVAYSSLEKFKKAKMPEILRDKRKINRYKRQVLKNSGLKEYFHLRKLLKETDFYLKNREKMNKKFILSEQNKSYEIEGNFLDKQQIEAVVACEDAELILASAGSGKSASLLAKENYLIKDLKIPAENILVIAFTRKVVKELEERMRGSGVEICTFHSFGNKVIKSQKIGKDLRLVPDGFLEKTVAKILDSWMKNGILKPEDLKEFGDLEAFSKLLISTLQLQKNEQISLKEFGDRIEVMKNPEERERARKFFNYYAKMVKIYGKILRDNRLYDFSDMLAWATRIVQKMPKGTLKYQYVLVDEVQDLSFSKSLLLLAILNNCLDIKLFAVGDDWQSIYRFAGSNLGVLQNFEKTFGFKTYRGVIRKTYRFGQPTAWVSEDFIRKNPHQSKKKVQTFKKTKTPIEICLNVKTNKKVPADYISVDGELQKMYAKMGDSLFEKRVQVISRYNRDLFRLVDHKNRKFKNAKIVSEKEDGVVLDWWIEAAQKNLEVAFCSMHKSKGITRDIVFVINMNEGDKGMPSTRADDPILAIMLAKPDPYPLAEERRLFYVAITRATEKTILVSDSKKPSRFVREIAKNLDGETVESFE